MVLEQGVIEGRKIFCNITHIKTDWHKFQFWKYALCIGRQHVSHHFS